MPWHDARLVGDATLSDVVIALLTPAVTASLPAGWQGSYDRERADAWIAARDTEGTTLLVCRTTDGAPVGLLILGEEPSADEPDAVEVRLGYLLARNAWGGGLATELIGGLIDWCRAQGRIRSLAGGVAVDNAASATVLGGHGFVPCATTGEDEAEDEVEYRLRLRAR